MHSVAALERFNRYALMPRQRHLLLVRPSLQGGGSSSSVLSRLQRSHPPFLQPPSSALPSRHAGRSSYHTSTPLLQRTTGHGEPNIALPKQPQQQQPMQTRREPHPTHRGMSIPHFFSMLKNMKQHNHGLHLGSFNFFVQALCLQNKAEAGFVVMNRVHEIGMNVRDTKPFCKLVSLCAAANKLDKAFMVPDLARKMGLQPDKCLYDQLLYACQSKQALDESFAVLSQMEQTPATLPDSNSFNIVLSICAKQGRLAEAQQVLDRMKAMNILPNKDTLYQLLNLYGETGQVEQAYAALQQMTPPLAASAFNEIIRALGKIRQLGQAFAVVDLMQTHWGVLPTHHTFIVLIEACINTDQPEKAMEVLEMMRKASQPLTVYIYNALLSGADTEDMRNNLLQMMQEEDIPANDDTFHILLRAYASHGQPEMAFKQLEKMSAAGLTISVDHFNYFMRACERSGAVDKAFEALDSLHKFNVTPDTTTFNLLLSVCNKKSKRMQEALSRMAAANVPHNKETSQYVATARNILRNTPKTQTKAGREEGDELGDKDKDEEQNGERNKVTDFMTLCSAGMFTTAINCLKIQFQGATEVPPEILHHFLAACNDMRQSSKAVWGIDKLLQSCSPSLRLSADTWCQLLELASHHPVGAKNAIQLLQQYIARTHQQQLFDDVSLWNAFILANKHQPATALRAFHRDMMSRSKVTPNVETWKALYEVGKAANEDLLLYYAFTSNLYHMESAKDPATLRLVLRSCGSKKQYLFSAIRQAELAGMPVSSACFDGLLEALTEMNAVPQAIALFKMIITKGFTLDVSTYYHIMQSCVNDNNWQQAQKILDMFEKDPNIFSSSQNNEEGTSSTDVVYEVMIEGFGKSQLLHEAFSLFNKLLAKKIKKREKPSLSTFHALLRACGHAKDPQQAQHVIDLIRHHGLVVEQQTLLELARAIGRSFRSPEEGLQALLQLMTGRTPSTTSEEIEHNFHAMLEGYATGDATEEEVVRLGSMVFAKMVSETGRAPNLRTFKAVASRLTSAKLFSQLRQAYRDSSSILFPSPPSSPNQTAQTLQQQPHEPQWTRLSSRPHDHSPSAASSSSSSSHAQKAILPSAEYATNAGSEEPKEEQPPQPPSQPPPRTRHNKKIATKGEHRQQQQQQQQQQKEQNHHRNREKEGQQNSNHHTSSRQRKKRHPRQTTAGSETDARPKQARKGARRQRKTTVVDVSVS